MDVMSETYDFIIVGAGATGINAAYRLKTQVPQASWCILESRDTLGGTWGFFKYPGIRSDSNLSLFGLPWYPYTDAEDMASGQRIHEYLTDAARSEGIDDKIYFQHFVQHANWSSEDQNWHLSVESDGTRKDYKATFLLVCTGYYDYDKPLETVIPGLDNFQGTVAHPQFWPSDLDWQDKKVVLIGSGATCITMLPVLAQKAGHVTMLQRSPSYVLSLPRVNAIGAWTKWLFPSFVANQMNWWRSYFMETVFIRLCLGWPAVGTRLLKNQMQELLPKSVPLDPHFNPRYNPFEQRVCITPDGEFFKAFHQENCDIITDTIDTVTADSVQTSSGQTINADIIITATGLHVRLFGGMKISVDGEEVDVSSKYAWRGAMICGLPSSGCCIGYTTASWTMGADASCKLLIKVYKMMKAREATSVVPVYEGGPDDVKKPIVSQNSTYFLAARERLPLVTGDIPWYGRIDSVFDYWQLWFGDLEKGLKFEIPDKKDR